MVGADFKHRFELGILGLEVGPPATDMGYHDDLAAGLGDVIPHPGLEVAGVDAFGLGGVVGDLFVPQLPMATAINGTFIIDEHYVAVAAGAGGAGPLPAEESGEAAGLVIFLGRQANLLHVRVRKDKIIALVGGKIDRRQVAGIGEVLIRGAYADGGCGLCLGIAPTDDLVHLVANDDRVGNSEDGAGVLEFQPMHTLVVQDHAFDPGRPAAVLR